MKATQWDLFCQFHQGWEMIRRIEQLETEAPPVRLTLHVEGELNDYEKKLSSSEFCKLSWVQAVDSWEVLVQGPGWPTTCQATFVAYGKTVKEARRNLRKKLAKAITLGRLEAQVFGRRWWGRAR